MAKKCCNCEHYCTMRDNEPYYCLDVEMGTNNAEQCKAYKDSRSCMNCANRIYDDWGGPKPCIQWEQLETDEQEKEMAQKCERYRRKTEYDEEYCPSATNGDYSPSSPWLAPGMSVKDFI